MNSDGRPNSRKIEFSKVLLLSTVFLIVGFLAGIYVCPDSVLFVGDRAVVHNDEIKDWFDTIPPNEGHAGDPLGEFDSRCSYYGRGSHLIFSDGGVHCSSGT